MHQNVDGYHSVPDPCLSKPCDPNADCKQLGEMSTEFSCTCRQPLTGDGSTCKNISCNN